MGGSKKGAITRAPQIMPRLSIDVAMAGTKKRRQALRIDIARE